MIVGVTFIMKPLGGQVFEGFGATLWRIWAGSSGDGLGKARKFA
ncbi:UNVERIFIED_ORG: hypothetical protein J2W85_004913 [Ensifer adhaerens]|jgi:hypothetical protein|nr:hypothetical protein [Ensifer adhaerens]